MAPVGAWPPWERYRSAGFCSCQVFMSSSLSVLSTVPPRFTKVPVDQIGVSGGVVSFVCQATGDPKPRVSWNKKGKKVNSQRIEVGPTDTETRD